MQKYLKKGRNGSHRIVVEAVQLDESNVDAIANWTQAQIVEEKDALNGGVSEGLNVKTPGGRRRASRGMYVIKHNDLFFVSSAGRFEQMYTPIEAEKPPEREARRPLVTDPFEGMTRFGDGKS